MPCRDTWLKVVVLGVVAMTHWDEVAQVGEEVGLGMVMLLDE